jgi:uncharacterized protein (DUF2132 family)
MNNSVYSAGLLQRIRNQCNYSSPQSNSSIKYLLEMQQDNHQKEVIGKVIQIVYC